MTTFGAMPFHSITCIDDVYAIHRGTEYCHPPPKSNIAGLPELIALGGSYRLKKPLDARAMVFSELPHEELWAFVPENAANQVGAWREFLRDVLEKPLSFLIRDRVWRGREKISERGFLAPWPWPPRKDGTLSTAPPPKELMTADDREFSEQRGI